MQSSVSFSRVPGIRCHAVSSFTRNHIVRALIIRVESACSQARRAHESQKFSAILSFEKKSGTALIRASSWRLRVPPRLTEIRLILEPGSIADACSTIPRMQDCLCFLVSARPTTTTRNSLCRRENVRV